MPIDASIPLGFQQPQPFQKLGELLNVARGALDYRKAQDTYGADVSQRQAESSLANTNANLASATLQPRIDQQVTATKKAQFGLTKDYMDTALQTATGMVNDPRIANADPNTYDPEKATEAILEAKRQMISKGVPETQAEVAVAPFVNAVHQPGAVQNMLKRTLAAKLSPGEQVGAATASGVPVTNNIQSAVVNTNPLAQQSVGAAIPGTTQTQLVPLGAQQSVGSDLQGNTIVGAKDAYGNVLPPKALPSSGQANPPPMMSFPAGESPTTKTALEGEALTAKNVALAAPQLHTNNQGILQEMDNVIATGATGNFVQRVASTLGALKGATDAEKAASAYDLVGKYLKRNAITAAAVMGPGTNAGLEAAVEANGSTAYNPTAIKTIAKLNDAIVTGSEKYAQGLQAAVQNGGNVFAKRQFDAQWAQNADVNTLKFLNAAKMGDKEETTAIIKSVGGAGSEGAKKLGEKLRNLQALTQRGSL